MGFTKEMINFLFFGFLLSIFCFYLRIKPRISQKNFGIDSWYFLLYAEELRKAKKLPLRLPYFLLDIEEQWYPPALPIFLTFFPQRFLEKYHWAISAFIDTVQMIILYLFTYLITKSQLLASLAGLLYVTTPILVTQSSNLNSRGLGALFLSLAMLSLYGYISTANFLYLFLTLLSGAILLNTHKLASQQLVFLLLGLTAFYFDPRPTLILGGIFLSAVILSGGFYLKIFRGHLQILKFWKRNLPFLGAHPIYRSPFYKDEIKARNRIGCGGIASNQLWFNLAKIQFAFLSTVIFFYAFINRQKLNPADIFFLNWFLINFLSVIIISYFPPVKFLGEGQRYFMYGIFPLSFLLPHLIFLGNSFIYSGVIFLGAFFITNLFLTSKIHSEQQKNILASLDMDLDEMIRYIKDLPKDNIICLPYSHAEPVAYFCRKKTLWGAHGGGFDKLQYFFPILLKPIEYFINTYDVSYMLLNKKYVLLKDLRLNVKNRIIKDNPAYVLVELFGA